MLYFFFSQRFRTWRTVHIKNTQNLSEYTAKIAFTFFKQLKKEQILLCPSHHIALLFSEFIIHIA